MELDRGTCKPVYATADAQKDTEEDAVEEGTMQLGCKH